MRLHSESSLAARLLTPLLAGACALLVAGLATGCGQKGSLTLPPAATAASAPAR